MKAAEPATIPTRETGLGEPSAVTSGVHRRAGTMAGWNERHWTRADWFIGPFWNVTVWEFRERRGVFYQAEIEWDWRRSLGIGATAFDALKVAMDELSFTWHDGFRHQVATVVPLPLWAREKPVVLRRRRARG